MTFREIYDEIGGDYDDFLNRIGREDRIEKWVRRFAENEHYDEMFKAYEAKDYTGVFEASHNLKGMAANISFNDIRDSISDICEAVRHGNPTVDMEPLMETVKAQREKLIKLLKE